MALDERARHELHARLDEVLGPDASGTLMELLPPVGWADVATKRDLELLETRMRLHVHDALRSEIGPLRAEFGSEIGSLRTEVGSEIGSLRTEVGSQIASVRGEIGALRTEVGAEIGSLRAEVGSEIASVRGEIGSVRGELRTLQRDIAQQTKTLFSSLTGVLLTLAGLALAASRVG